MMLNRPVSTSTAVLLVVSLLLMLGGCGYSAKEVFPQEVRTVAVPIFENRSFYQGMEFDLTEALTKEIESRTPYKVIAANAADTTLEGTITAVEQTTLSRRRDGGLPQEMEVRVLINWQWKNLRTGEVIRGRQGFEAVGRYVPTRPYGEELTLAQHAAMQRMAQQIVSAMRADW